MLLNLQNYNKCYYKIIVQFYYDILNYNILIDKIRLDYINLSKYYLYPL